MHRRKFLLAALAVVALAAVLSSDTLAGRRKRPKPPANPEVLYVYRNGGPGQIVVMNADGRNKASVFKFADGRWLGYPSWSPDGTQIAFQDDFNIWSIDVDLVKGKPKGSNLRQLTSYPEATPRVRRPRWSPLGDEILFHRKGPSALYLVSADGGTPRLLYDPGEGKGVAHNSATWITSGDEIAFRETGSGVHDLRILDVDSGEIVETIPLPDGSSFFDWARTRDVLVFQNGGALWTLDLATEEIALVVAVGKFASWSPDDSKIVYFTDVCGLRVKTYDFATGRIRTRARYGDQPDWRR